MTNTLPSYISTQQKKEKMNQLNVHIEVKAETRLLFKQIVFIS